MLFTIALRSHIALSKHGSLWNLIKRDLFSTQKGSAIVISQVTVIYIVLYIIQIVSKQLYSNKQAEEPLFGTI